MQEITVTTDLAAEPWRVEAPVTYGQVTHVGLWAQDGDKGSNVELLVESDDGTARVVASLSLALYIKAGTAMMVAHTERIRS